MLRLDFSKTHIIWFENGMGKLLNKNKPGSSVGLFCSYSELLMRNNPPPWCSLV